MNVYKMNVICCFYLKDRLRKHPNYTYTETPESCTIEYSLKEPLFTLKWDKLNGVIFELDRHQNLVKIGTPTRAPDGSYFSDVMMIQPFLGGGFYWVDWRGAE
jgi:hypothetical protein